MTEEEILKQKRKEARKTILVENPTNFPENIKHMTPPGIIYVGEMPKDMTDKEVMEIWQ